MSIVPTLFLSSISESQWWQMYVGLTGVQSAWAQNLLLTRDPFFFGFGISKRPKYTMHQSSEVSDSLSLSDLLLAGFLSDAFVCFPPISD